MSADRVEIGNCIIAGMAEGGTCLEQMSEIVTCLELAGFVIVPREPLTLWKMLRKHGVGLYTAQMICNDVMANGLSLPDASGVQK
jgi:hypothetical protein